MKKRKGWFRKAKIKFIEENIYSYELTKRGMFGSDYIEVRRKPNIVRTVWYGGNKADWQYDMEDVAGFAERFIWAQNIARTQADKFYFNYKRKNNLQY